MTPVDPLLATVQHTHDHLAARLSDAASGSTRGQPRKGYEAIDTFLAMASRHLGAVDAVLLPAARDRLDDGAQVVHDYLQVARHLEVVLAHVKARAYGSVFESGFRWEDVWEDVRRALEEHRRSETRLAQRLGATLSAEGRDELTERLHHYEPRAPTRPHPYAPHTGFAGLVARKILHAADVVWDGVEGRMVPGPSRPQRREPGLVAQYFLGDPRMHPRPRTRGRRHG